MVENNNISSASPPDENNEVFVAPGSLENDFQDKTNKKPRNKPRSNKIILVIAITLICVLTFVFFNISTSGTSTNTKQAKDKGSEVLSFGEIPSNVINSNVSGMGSSNSSYPDVLNEKGDGPQLILANDGRLIPEDERAITTSNRPIKVVYKTPADEYRQAKALFMSGLIAETTVISPHVAFSEERLSVSGAGTNNDMLDPEVVYNAGYAAGIGNVNTTNADKNNNFVQSLQKPQSVRDEYVPNTRRAAQAKYELKAGSIISGVMVTGINSDLPGTILGQVSENVYDTATGRYLLIPQGSRVIGSYNSHIVYGQQRILVVWNRIIYPDGSSLNVGGMTGSDQAGYGGMKQYVNNHYGRLIGAALFSSVFVALGKIATEDDKNDDGTESSAAEAVMEQLTSFGVQLAEKNLNISPTLMIKPGRRFTIITTKDVAFQEDYRM